jgi:hypothetical protein
MRAAVYSCILSLVLATSVSPVDAATAEEAPRQQRADADVLTFFYRDPKPERLVGFLDRYDKIALTWESYPPIVGFFGVVFGQYPEWIDQLVPVTLSGRLAEALRAAFRLSHREIPEQLTERFAIAGTDETLKAELRELPSSPRDLVVLRPTHLDILWGASFASGEKFYVRRIFEFFAATADRSVDMAIDVSAVATWMSGAGGDIPAKLKSKYGEDTFREIIFAGSALWALVANARRHSFVHEELSEYAKNAKVTKATDGSVVVEGSLASWVVGLYLKTSR